MTRQRCPRQVTVPPERNESLRQSLIYVLRETERTARELSEAVGIPEREVYGHLLHLRRSLRHSAKKLLVRPAECLGCGFVFTKRGRLKKPGHCPLCHGTQIRPPRYLLKEVGQ